MFWVVMRVSGDLTEGNLSVFVCNGDEKGFNDYGDYIPIR